MKKIKRTLALLLAVVAVCSLFLTPANAVTGSVSDKGSGTGYSWSSSLSVSTRSATAQLTVEFATHGALVQALTATLSGAVYNADGTVIATLYDYQQGIHPNTIVASNTTTYKTEATGVLCNYYVSGHPAGNGLIVGVIPGL